jgi:predicted MFS family arabinose efflux permease
MRKMAIVLCASMALQGCATYRNPYTGEQTTYLTEQGQQALLVLGTALIIGAAAVAVSRSQPYGYQPQQICNQYGCRYVY